MAHGNGVNEGQGRQTRQRLDVSALILVAILLAAGFILNLTVGKALSVTGIQPEFVLSSVCLAILLLEPGVPQALVIGMLGATVIQITTSVPLLEYLCDFPASIVCGLLAHALLRSRARGVAPLVVAFVTTVVSGLIFASVSTLVVLRAPIQNIVVMFPVVFGTAVANAVVVQALYVPLKAVVARFSRARVQGQAQQGQRQASAKAADEPARGDVAPQEGPAPVVAPVAGPAPGGGDAVIRLDDVSFVYDESGHRGLDHVSLEVRRGEFVGVIGPSGAGKTTLAAVLAGAIPHHYAGDLFGAAYVDGRDTCTISLTDVSRVVGSVLQDIDAQMVASNVEDELLYGLENFGVPHDKIPGVVSDALNTVGIADLRDREIATLSGGQKQKVAIAAILALHPSVMVLDEPTAALDPASSRTVFETLRRLNEREGITVVVIEQKVALLTEFCKRMLVVSEGRIAFDGSPRQVLAHAGELRKLGVDCPRTTRVSNKLFADGLTPRNEVCVTVPETAALIGRVVGGNARKTVEYASTAPVVAAGGEEPVLVFDHVGFSYGAGQASVTDLTFQARPGELVGIVGQNGAGKTTATKLMNGLLKPASGRVVIAGCDTSQVRTSEIARYVSTLFQNPDRQICKNTVLEEVAFSLELLGVQTEEAQCRAREVIARFGLPADAAPFALSRGQRQIVALASVIVTEPRVLILDEPTSGLDYRECMVVMDAVNAARERGCAVVMVCHDMEVAADFATRLIVMADGRILADGLPSDLFRQGELMAQAYVAAPQMVQLSEELGRRVSPSYLGLTEVHDIVEVTERLADRG